jgi:hypothetical protein
MYGHVKPMKIYFLDISGSSHIEELQTTAKRILAEIDTDKYAIKAYVFAEKLMELADVDLVAIVQLGSEAIEKLWYEKVGQPSTMFKPVFRKLTELSNYGYENKEVVIISDLIFYDTF